jgi:exocyst complex component 2
VLIYSAGSSQGESVWQAIFDMTKNVSEVLIASLPNFWKISKNFIDGKYKKVMFKRSAAQRTRV